MVEYFTYISKKALTAEYMRHLNREKIIEMFADEIDKIGGFRGSSKTTNKCITLGTKAGIMAMMERWFLIQSLYGANEEDPILPHNPKEDKWLKRELEEGGFFEEKITLLEEKLAEICNSIFDQFQQSVNEMDESETVQIMFMVTIRKMVFSFSLENEEIQLPILKDHYEQLRKMYGLEEGPIPKDNKTQFYQHLLLLLFRYHDISSYELSIPNMVIKSLQDRYGLQHECFSSPMDVSKHISSFCSRFPDTDTPFGSNGSFFDCFVEEGCYECNPPPIEEFLIRNMTHVLTCLEKADQAEKPLTFFVVTPYWNEPTCQSYNLALYGTPTRPENENEMGKYYVMHLLFDRDSHFYRNGTAYRTGKQTEKAGQHSMIIVLQNDKARETVPIGTKSDLEGVVNTSWSLESEEYKNRIRMPMYNQGGRKRSSPNQNRNSDSNYIVYPGKRNRGSREDENDFERRRRRY